MRVGEIRPSHFVSLGKEGVLCIRKPLAGNNKAKNGKGKFYVHRDNLFGLQFIFRQKP